jgi:hypothetical protein
MNLELPLEDPRPNELDRYLGEIDRAVDESFLAEIDAAFERAEVDRELADRVRL